MTEEAYEHQKVIFTDTYKTKDLIWDAYAGYVEHYHNFKMYSNFHASDPLTFAGLNKYAWYMYYEIEGFLDDFKKELDTETEKNCDKLKLIFKKKAFTIQDYDFMRSFFAKFMRVSGIKNIVREKENIGKTIRNNR